MTIVYMTGALLKNKSNKKKGKNIPVTRFFPSFYCFCEKNNIPSLGLKDFLLLCAPVSSWV